MQAATTALEASWDNTKITVNKNGKTTSRFVNLRKGGSSFTFTLHQLDDVWSQA
jgi:hypothetical protein